MPILRWRSIWKIWFWCGTRSLENIFNEHPELAQTQRGTSSLPVEFFQIWRSCFNRNRCKKYRLNSQFFGGYNFLYILPDKNAYGGVGIYVSDSLNDIFLINSQFKKTCTCPRCEIESLVIDFTHCGSKYTICGQYRHPNGDGLHFINDLEHMIKSLDVKNNWILAGDINIDLIKYQDEKCSEILNHIDVSSNVSGCNSSYSSNITFCYMHW